MLKLVEHEEKFYKKDINFSLCLIKHHTMKYERSED
jgi:hypothetical protein